MCCVQGLRTKHVLSQARVLDPPNHLGMRTRTTARLHEATLFLLSFSTTWIHFHVEFKLFFYTPIVSASTYPHTRQQKSSLFFSSSACCFKLRCTFRRNELHIKTSRVEHYSLKPYSPPVAVALWASSVTSLSTAFDPPTLQSTVTVLSSSTLQSAAHTSLKCTPLTSKSLPQCSASVPSNLQICAYQYVLHRQRSVAHVRAAHRKL